VNQLLQDLILHFDAQFHTTIEK